MTTKPIFTFIFLMWVLIIIGGGILVYAIAPISISGLGDFNLLVSSAIKAIIAISLVIIWVFILLKMKKNIFHKMLRR